MDQESPLIPLVRATQIIPFSTQYWTNYPTSENYYAYPFPSVFADDMTCVLYFKSTNIKTTTVYFTKDTRQFSQYRPDGTYRGVDQNWYGPFKAGNATILPVDDAEFWVAQGYASLSPVIPTIPTELIQGIADDVSSLKTSINSLDQRIAAMPTVDVSGLTTLLYAVIGLQAIVLIAVLAVVMRKK